MISPKLGRSWIDSGSRAIKTTNSPARGPLDAPNDIIGDNIEHLFGRLRFALLVIGGGLIGGLIHVFLTRATATPMVGASGAIAAVMAAYLWSFPKAKLFQTIPFLLIQVKIPAWVYLVIWLALQFLMGFFTDTFEMAWFSHIGGFIFGLAVTPLALRGRRRRVAKTVAVPVPAYVVR